MTTINTPPDELIRILLAGKWNQDEIAAACDTSQVTISRIHSGAHANPGYQIVDRLRVLVAELEQFKVEE